MNSGLRGNLLLGGSPDLCLQDLHQAVENVVHDGRAHHQAHVARSDGLAHSLRGRVPAAQSQGLEQAAVGVDPPPLLVHVAPRARVEPLPGEVGDHLGEGQRVVPGVQDPQAPVGVQPPPAAKQQLRHTGVHAVAELEREAGLVRRQDGGDV